MTVPEAPAGTYIVSFQPENSVTNTNFQFSVKPGLRVNLTAVSPGDVIQIKGTGFSSNHPVSLIFNNTTLGNTITANTNGSFNQSVTVPAVAAGTYNLVATDQNTGMHASIALEILAPPEEEPEDVPQEPENEIVPPVEMIDDIPPPIPVPISPMGHKIGVIGSQAVVFTWSEVFDESGVKYDLEVVKKPDPEPADIVLSVNNLSVTSYAAAIEPGTYFWRVRAIDGAGNESYWRYAQHSFQVGELSVLLIEFVNIIEGTGLFPVVVWIVTILILFYVLWIIIRKFLKSRRKDYYN